MLISYFPSILCITSSYPLLSLDCSFFYLGVEKSVYEEPQVSPTSTLQTQPPDLALGISKMALRGQGLSSRFHCPGEAPLPPASSPSQAG